MSLMANPVSVWVVLVGARADGSRSQDRRARRGYFAGADCRRAKRTSRISAIRIGDTEVTGQMTSNWAAAVVNVLILAFFVVVLVGIGIGAYAATTLKKLEEEKKA